jgi:hypothetical protein
MRPRVDNSGRLNFWFVVPTVSLRDLVIRRLLKQYPCLNYVIGWKDVRGFGLEVTVSEWAGSNLYLNLR